ncbi:NID1, partial [Branchiostoma lanceolatum]
DPCSHPDCSPNAKCIPNMVTGEHTCECLPGFTGNGIVCTSNTIDPVNPDNGNNGNPIDPVDPENKETPPQCLTNDCDANANCISVGDGYSCVCKQGYVGDGRTCTELDPCNPDPCGPNAFCFKHGTQWKCRCEKGFQGDGDQCFVIEGPDPCRTSDCHPNANCLPTSSSYRCECRAGYKGDGRLTCNPADPCDDNKCDRNAMCIPVGPRSYRCECKNGYQGNGFTCGAAAASIRAGEDPCGHLICDVNARCLFQGGRPVCRCNQGFEGNGFFCKAAVRYAPANWLDPCASNEHDCDRDFGRCVYEGQGRYRCECAPGHAGDGRTCNAIAVLPSPCEEGSHNCDENAVCINEGAGRYSCRCRPGLVGNGWTCHGKDPIATPVQPPANPCDRASCAPPGQGFCVPVSLSQYRCECLPGFRDVNGDGRVCQAIQPPGPQPSGNPCDRSNCAPEGQAKCIPLGPTDFRCECLPGYSGDGRVCTDMDECDLLDPACDPNARCINTFGSYRCECAPGFVGDGRTCSPVGQAPQASLLFAQGMSISRIPVPAQGYRGQIIGAQSAARGKKVLVKAGMTAVGIDYDCVDGYMYFTDVTGRSISRAKMDGSQPEVIISQGLSSPEGVAVDWISKNLYWTDSGTDVIEVSKLDGTNRRVLFKDDLVNPRSIVVEPFSGTMYWTDWNRDKPKIATANMDATNRRTFVDSEIALPNGITIDYPANQLCWADAGTKKVECATLGTAANRRTVYTPTQYPFSMTSYQGRLFYTDWQRDAVLAVNPQSQTEQGPLPLPLGSSGNPYGITTITNTCRRGANACSVRNGDCSHLCLPRPGNQRSCVCPSNQYSNEAACVE